jgi:hypothetical protein
MTTKEIYTDGSGDSRGTSALCIIRKNWPGLLKKEQRILQIIPRGLKVYDIESLSIIEAIKLIPEIESSDYDYIIYNDNLGLVNDLNNLNNHKELIKHIQSMIMKKKINIVIKWISREKNPAGIYLEHRLKRINGYLRASVGKR